MIETYSRLLYRYILTLSETNIFCDISNSTIFLSFFEIPVKSNVYESISLPVRHYDFKIKFLRNNYSNVRLINFSVKRIAESNVENAQNNVLGHFGRNQNRIYIFSSQLVTAKII